MLQGISREKASEAGKRVEDIRLALLGMSQMFNPKAAGDLKATIQFEVTGKQPGNWFLTIADGKCTYQEGKAASPTLTIKTPSEIWLAIANKELDGAKAFMKGKYTANGDMGLMMKMKTYFGSAE